jgi:hypothetical protein
LLGELYLSLGKVDPIALVAVFVEKTQRRPLASCATVQNAWRGTAVLSIALNER